jgi:FMN phosphatase YigB (HAD superfamily)
MCALLQTFDLFDTLLARRCGCSESLTEVVGEDAARAGLLDSPEAYVRYVAKALQRLGARTRGDWPLAAIHRAMAELAPRADEALTELASAAEVRMATKLPTSVARLERALAEGQRVAIVSDTHLEREHVVRVLAAIGIDAAALAGLFLSSEGRGRKADGSLLRTVRAALDPRVGGWLHIGDNAISDGLYAELAGARTELVRDSVRCDERLLRRLRTALVTARPSPTAPVAIWGAGQRGWALLRACRLAAQPVACVWDRNHALHGRTLDGVPIVSPWAQHPTFGWVACPFESSSASEPDLWTVPEGVWRPW